MANFTCKGCGNRYPGCHAHCEKYIAEKKAYDEKMAEYRKKHALKTSLDSQMYDTIGRALKRQKKKGASKYGGQ